MHEKTIAFYCSSIAWGGLEMNTVRYASWMQEKGWNVLMFCVADSAIQRESNQSNLKVILVLRNRKYFDIVNAFRVKKLFVQHQVGLCWFRDTRDFDLLGWVKRFSGGNIKLLYQQAMQFGVSKKDILHTFRFSAVDAWVSTLHFLAEQVKSQTHFAHEKIHVIPLGVDVDRLHMNKPSKAEARNILNLPAHGKYLGIIGRIDPLKGQHIALEAFLKIAEAHPDLHLLVFGESTLHEGNAYEENLKRIASSSSFTHRIHFRPYSAFVEQFYCAIDIFLLCSKGETFGTVTIEAMSFGLPIIGTNSSGTPEILDAGSCGLLVAPEDSSELALSVAKLIADPSLEHMLAMNAKSRFDLQFSKQASVTKLNQLVTSLLSNEKSS